jgi:predicted dehydrogenase
MKPGLCVVGCGAFAKTFARGVNPLRGRINLFFASRDRSRAQEYSAQFGGAGAFGSYEAAAAHPAVDAMYLCTPHHLHLEHVRLAARAGKHILVEKPIAPTLPEARQIIDAARQAGVALMVAENYRFMAAVRECRRLVENGTIGQLRLVQLQEEAPFSPGGWRNQKDLNGGGILIDGGIHKIHFLRYLSGEPASIYATALPEVLDNHEGEDGVVIIARWKSGAVGLINHSWAACRQPSPRLVSVSGSKGRLTFAAGESWLRIERGDSEETLSFPPDNAGLTAMVQEFLNSIRENREPETSGTEGLKDLSLVLKAYESIERGVPIRAS